jgi:hypothetical protein
MKTCVLLHGGLGNQLFQWAFAHRIKAIGSEVSMVFFQRVDNVPHASKTLRDFLPDCVHANFSVPVPPLPRIKQLVCDPTFHLNFLRLLPRYLYSTIDNPFLQVDPEQSSKFRFNFGYYQNWKLVEPIAEVVVAELFSALDNRGKSRLETELYGCEVIHIRQNDIKSHEHISNIGILSHAYYQGLPRKSHLKRIVLTDDVIGASDVLKGIEIDGVYGPNDLDAYQSLNIMSQAATLFAANSTLSWWGGLLAQSRGANVHIPYPFFRKFSPEPRESFAFPGFSLRRSNFVTPGELDSLEDKID